MADKILPQRVSPFCSPAPILLLPPHPPPPHPLLPSALEHRALTSPLFVSKNSLKRGASQARGRVWGGEEGSLQGSGTRSAHNCFSATLRCTGIGQRETNENLGTRD